MIPIKERLESDVLIVGGGIAVLLRDIAEKMIVARGSRPAALRVGLIQQGYARAFVRRRNSGHKSGNTAADDENVRF